MTTNTSISDAPEGVFRVILSVKQHPLLTHPSLSSCGGRIRSKLLTRQSVAEDGAVRTLPSDATCRFRRPPFRRTSGLPILGAGSDVSESNRRDGIWRDEIEQTADCVAVAKSTHESMRADEAKLEPQSPPEFRKLQLFLERLETESDDDMELSDSDDDEPLPLLCDAPLVSFDDDDFLTEDDLVNALSPWESFLSPIKPSSVTRRVNFAVNTTVFTIPSHREFTKEEKKHIWTSPRSIRREASRNYKEWDYEGEDWKNVIEEEQFISSPSAGFVHPAHTGV